jgi:hypothetical protein
MAIEKRKGQTVGQDEKPDIRQIHNEPKLKIET